MSKLKFHVDSESVRYQDRKSILKKLQKIIMFYTIYKIKKSFGTDHFHKIYKKSLNTYFFICDDIQNCLIAIIYKSRVSALVHAWRGRHWEKIHESDWSDFSVLKNREFWLTVVVVSVQIQRQVVLDVVLFVAVCYSCIFAALFTVI